jgi:hypothetical protein
MLNLHNIIIPDVSQPPFPIVFPRGAWEPGYPLVHNRDYFIVFEVAKVCTKKKIIRKVASSNKEGAESTKVTGIQQIRKWIRYTEDDRKPSPPFPLHGFLFKKSKKYGYLISKKDFADFYFYMTGGDYFDEKAFHNCLLREDNLEFLDFKESEYRAKIEALNRELKEGLNDTKKIKEQIEILQERELGYRQLWLKEALK